MVVLLFSRLHSAVILPQGTHRADGSRRDTVGKDWRTKSTAGKHPLTRESRIRSMRRNIQHMPDQAGSSG
jgi:hypothetical protein